MRSNAFTLTLVLFFSAALTQAQFIPEKTFTLSNGFLGNSFLAKGDFNRDGKLDVLLPATSSSNTPELAVFPGNGAGGFAAALVTPISGANSLNIVTAGDINGDGIPDVVISGTDPITGQTEFGVMLADGTGKFKGPIFTHSANFSGIVLGDFDHDGKVDLVEMNSPVVFYPGNGDGTFGSPVTTPIVAGGACFATADFNKDGKLDITTGTEVFLGNGDGTFKAALPVTNGGCSVAVGDFNNDGIPDLVEGSFASSKPNAVRVFLGDGSGSFKASTVYNTGTGAGAAFPGLAVDKFNADTNLDIAVENTGNNDVTLLIGKGDGTFTIGKTFAVSTTGILSGDFNGDHKTDLAVNTRRGFSVLLGKGDGTLIAQTAQNGQHGGAIHLADFNGDGKIDAFEFAFNGPNAAVLLGNGSGGFGTPILLPSSCQSNTGVIVDFNHDKKPDLAFADVASGGVAVCLGNGDGTFNPAVIFDSGVQHGEVLFGDFNHDGKMDIAATDVGGISILLGNGDGTFQSAILTALSNFSNPATGDFNHDGKLDIVALDQSTGFLEVLLGKGDGTFEAPLTTASPNSFLALVVGDVNGDGIPDVVTGGRNGTSSGLNFFLGKGDGTFKAPVFRPFLFGNVQLRDLNGDGKLDVVASGFGTLEVVLGNGDLTFQTPKVYPAPLGSSSLGVADVNGDGRLDVAYLTQTGSGQQQAGTLTVYLNQGP